MRHLPTSRVTYARNLFHRSQSLEARTGGPVSFGLTSLSHVTETLATHVTQHVFVFDLAASYTRHPPTTTN